MANSFRYYNLAGLSGLGKYNGLGIDWKVEKTVDLRDLTNWGVITGAASSFPNHGAGLEHTVILSTSYSLGGITATAVNDAGDQDFGTIV
jgi:hypothetical protein|tara:strand:+ start:259 stop:528 length:270 start_codon:yes stop_codon:yes gene_type:complete